MKKIFWLWSAFISCIIVSLSVLISPGYIFGTQYAFGYPFAWLLVDKDITLVSKDILLDHIGIALLMFFVDVFIFMIVIIVLIKLFEVIFRGKKKIENNN